MAIPYYAAGEELKRKNSMLSGTAADFPRWAIDRLDLDGATRAVDVGCGWGRFARPLMQAAPRLSLVALDVWPGMVATCRGTLNDAGVDAAYAVGDARALPLRDRSFDLVMANHMLYEFASVDEPIAELARVLAPTGQLLATTYSSATRVPLIEFHRRALDELGIARPAEATTSFSLENGEAVLGRQFAAVDVHVVDERDELAEAESLVRTYLATARFHDVADDPDIPATTRAELGATFERIARRALETEGPITTITRWTAFVARRPR